MGYVMPNVVRHPMRRSLASLGMTRERLGMTKRRTGMTKRRARDDKKESSE